MTNKSQNKFTVGDKVVRTESYVVGGDFGFMYEGRECIVLFCREDHLVCVEGSNMWYDARCFKLVQPKFANMKFKVTSPEHSKEIQEALFEMGYKWGGQSTVLNFVDNPFLYSEDTGIIAIGQSQDFFERLDTHQEYLVETTKSYKLIPIESPKETITIDGKTYDKEAVLKRLAELDEVK